MARLLARPAPAEAQAGPFAAASGARFAVSLFCGLLIALGVAAWMTESVGGTGCALLRHARSCSGAELSGAAIGAAALLGVALLAALLPGRAALWFCAGLAAVVGLSVVGAFVQGSGRAVGFGRVALVAVPALLLGSGLARTGATWPRAFRRALAGLWSDWSWLVLLGAMLAGTAIYVQASRRILYWDPINYWEKTDQVAAALSRKGPGMHVLLTLLRTAADEYSMIPAILPGALRMGQPGYDLLGYMLAVALVYVFPAGIATGVLGLRLAASARTAPDGSAIGGIVLGGFAGFALFPMFLHTFLAGVMLDIGGVPLLAVLILAWHRCIETIARGGQEAAPASRALDLAWLGAAIALLSLLAFVFRRWYVFDVLGFGFAAVLYLGLVLWRGSVPRRAALREIGIVFAVALLAGATAGAPVVARWIASWQSRQYAAAYSAYWLDWANELRNALGAFGLVAPAASLLALAYLLWRGRVRSLPFLLLVGTAFAVLAFYRVQMMWWQHYYLLMPLFAGGAAALAILAARHAGWRAVIAALAAAAWLMALAPRHEGALALVQPRSVELRPVADPDIAELRRLGRWLRDDRPGDRYCVAASSLVFNGSLVSNIWQVEPALLGTPVQTGLIWLNEIDSRDGPPDGRVAACSVMIAATPPQTHLKPSDQEAILLVRADLLAGTGIGAAYEQTPAAFRLAGGIAISTYRQVRPIDPAALADLRRQFYAGKGAAAAAYEARFGAP